MVALVPAISMWVIGLFALVQVLKPRLPTYRFQVVKFPLLSWINGKLKTRLGADVRLRNDNYIPIDVHALSFDLYYHDYWASDDSNTLGYAHIGNVQDRTQGTKSPKRPIQRTNKLSMDNGEEIPSLLHMSKRPANYKPTTSSAETSTAIKTKTAHSTTPSSSSPPPLWALSPRQAFETIDEVLLSPSGTLGAMSSLSWDWMEQGGVLDIPSSGVIQIKANKNLPLTLDILCDNVLDTWTMELQGVSCSLHSVELGWKDMTTKVETLRERALQRLRNPKTQQERRGQQKQQRHAFSNTENQLSISSLEDEIKKLTRLDWKTALPMLAL